MQMSVRKIRTWRDWEEKKMKRPGISAEFIIKAEEWQGKFKEFDPERGHPGIFLYFPSRTIEAHISELPPGGRSGLHRHHNEAIIYILRGKGFSEVNGKIIEWKAGDFLYIPPNAWHYHKNTSQSEPAWYLAVTNSPLMRSLAVERWEDRGIATYSDVSKERDHYYE